MYIMQVHLSNIWPWSCLLKSYDMKCTERTEREGFNVSIWCEFHLMMLDSAADGAFSLSSWTLTTWGTVFRVDSVREALTAGRKTEGYVEICDIKRIKLIFILQVCVSPWWITRGMAKRYETGSHTVTFKSNTFWAEGKTAAGHMLALPVFWLAICLRRAAVAAACWAEMVTGTVLSFGGAPCFTVFVARAVLSAPLRLILLVGTKTSIETDMTLKKAWTVRRPCCNTLE